MALYELARTLNCTIKVNNGVPAALYCRFATWDPAQVGVGDSAYEVITHVPGANGAAARGILAQKADPNAIRAFAAGSGLCNSQIAIPEGGQCLIELGEAVTQFGQALRVGGNGGEIDGAAYLANAAGDVIVAYALVAAAPVGEIIPIQFVGYAGVVP